MFDRPEKLPDRPLECNACKRQIAVVYTEIAGNVITHTSMCSECPELQKRLYGSGSLQNLQEIETGLSCGNCGTSLEAVKKGASLGCMVCYDVFEDIIIEELMSSKRISSKTSKKPAPLYIGRTPGEPAEINPSLRLLALNEALKETLIREDYEQAAWLRDQIKALTEKPDEDHEKK